MCLKWLPNLYIDRHDSVARCIHYRCCKIAGLSAPRRAESVPGIMANERFRLCWNYPVQTFETVKHNKPDMILFDLSSHKATVIEIAISWYTRLEQQRELKRSRYTINGNYDEDLSFPYPSGNNICRELRAQGWETRFIGIVIGACGEMSLGLVEELDKIGINRLDALDCIERMSRAAALGSNRIVKNHLAQAEIGTQ